MIDRNASCILVGFRPECILAGPRSQDIFDFICESVVPVVGARLPLDYESRVHRDHTRRGHSQFARSFTIHPGQSLAIVVEARQIHGHY